MKIAFFVWEYWPRLVGGLGTYAIEITKKFEDLGHEVTVFTLNDGNLKTLEKWNGIEIHRPMLVDSSVVFPLFIREDLKRWGTHLKFFSDIFSYNYLSASKFINLLIRRNGEKFDIVAFHDWLSAFAGAIIEKEMPSLPTVFHIHSIEEQRALGGGSQIIKEIEREAAKGSDGIITVSNSMKDFLVSLGYPQEKINVCYNGCDPDKYDPKKVEKEKVENLRKLYKIKPEEKVIFFVGRLTSVKGVYNLVRAMPSVLQEFPNTKLIILGKGEQYQDLITLIQQLNIAEKVYIRSEWVSVDYSEPIIIRKNGIVQLVPIGEFVDTFFNNDKKEGKIKILESGFEALSFDPLTYKLDFRPISHVIRHKFSEDLFELEVETGRRVKVTGSHSVFVLENGHIISKKVSEIGLGDYLIIPKKIPILGNEIKEINLMEFLSNAIHDKSLFEQLYVCDLPQKLLKLVPKKELKWYMPNQLSLATILKYNLINKIPSSCKLRVKYSSKKIPCTLKMTKDLMKLLGYFTSEGSVEISKHRNHLYFTFNKNETWLVKDVRKCLKNIFGVNSSLRHPKPSVIEVVVSDKLLCILFSLLAGRRSQNRLIPYFIYNLSPFLQDEYLKCVFLGDGSFKSDPTHLLLKNTTTSERLASELSYLLLGRGIISEIHKRGNNSVWDVVITNRLQIKKCDYLNGIGDIKLQEFLRQPHVTKVPIEKSGIVKILERMSSRKITSGGSLGHKRFHERKLERIIQLCESRGINVGHLKKLIYGDLAFARIKKIRKVRPTKTFVYDLSVPGCENFIGGFGGVCLHNSEDERILHYALADLCVFPSISEPFGIVSLEAMSMEKPVVVGAAGINGLREQVIPSGENRTGVHVNGENPQDIAWGIKEILRNFEEAKKWGKNGRKRVLKEFTWDKAAKRTLEIYEKVIK